MRRGLTACGSCLLPSSVGMKMSTGTTNVAAARTIDHFPIHSRTSTRARACCMDDDMVIKGPTGQSFFLRITHPSPRAAVIWLEEKKLREKWCGHALLSPLECSLRCESPVAATALNRFCNVRFGEGLYCKADSNPFASMPHTLLGIIQVLSVLIWTRRRASHC